MAAPSDAQPSRHNAARRPNASQKCVPDQGFKARRAASIGWLKIEMDSATSGRPNDAPRMERIGQTRPT